jgi:hypothetical protein
MYAAHWSPAGPGEATEIEDVAQLVVHDINNFLAVIGGFVAGCRLAALAGTLDRALRPDIAVRAGASLSSHNPRE